MAASEQKQQERAAWGAQASQKDAHQLVFIDECGSNIALTLRYGWADLRAASHRLGPSQSRQEHDLDCLAFRWDGMGESMILEGAANAAAFEQYVEFILAPHLSAGQIVVMDKLPLP